MNEKFVPKTELDPFKLVSSQMRDMCIMEDIDLFNEASEIIDPQYHPEKRQRVPDDFSDPMLIGGSRAWSRRKREAEMFTVRFWFGLVGGLALIGPMLLMVLLRAHGIAVSLITASLSTILFALLMAKFSDQSPVALVGTTAAYAAVMVVFVGSST